MSKPKDSFFAKLRRFTPLILMVLIVGVPFGGSYYSYFTGNTSWLGASEGNRGVLVNPLIDLNNIIEPNTDARWKIGMWIDRECSASCLDKLWEIRQARFALGKEAEQLHRFVVAETALELDDEFVKANGELEFLTGFEASTALLSAYGLSHGSVVVLDEENRAVLVYGADQSASDYLKDLNRLIKGKRS